MSLLRYLSAVSIVLIALMGCAEESPQEPSVLKMEKISVLASIGDPDVLMLDEKGAKETIDVSWTHTDKVYLYAIHGNTLEVLSPATVGQISQGGKVAEIDISYPVVRGGVTLIGSLAPLSLRDGKLVSTTSSELLPLADVQRRCRYFEIKEVTKENAAQKLREITLSNPGYFLSIDVTNEGSTGLVGEFQLIGPEVSPYVYCDGLAMPVARSLSEKKSLGPISKRSLVQIPSMGKERLAVWIASRKTSEGVSLAVLYKPVDPSTGMRVVQVPSPAEARSEGILLSALRWTGKDLLSSEESVGNVPYITFTTQIPVGGDIRLQIFAEEADQKDAWIDLNNNGVREEGEEIKEFAPKTNETVMTGEKTYSVKSPTITIYGKIVYLKALRQKLTFINVVNDPYLKQLNCGINSLKEINVEHNPLLEYLNIFVNQVAIINLEKNVELRELFLSNNLLKEVNVSTLTKLTNLQLDHNFIEGISLGNNPDLEWLYCDNNKLSKLDIGAQGKLQRLYCFDNNLTELDVTGCPELFNLMCARNKIEKLDLSRNPKLLNLECNNNKIKELSLLNHQELSRIQCDTNQLQVLNITGAVGRLVRLRAGHNDLTGIVGLEKAERLSDFQCDHNRISHLDLSGLSYLSYLVCNNNKIRSLLFDGTTHRSLEYIDCTSCELRSIDVSALVSLKRLECAFNELSGIVVSSQSRRLGYLDCRNNQLSPDGLNALFHNLPERSYDDERHHLLILGNPGEKSCDKNEAYNKSWQFYDKAVKKEKRAAAPSWSR